MKKIALLTFCLGMSLPAAASKFVLPTLTTKDTSSDNSLRTFDNEDIAEFERKQWNMNKKDWMEYQLYISTNNPASRYFNMDSVTPYRIMYFFAKTNKEKNHWAMEDARYYSSMLMNDAESFEDIEKQAATLYPETPVSEFAPEHFNNFGPIQLSPMSSKKKMRSIMLIDVSDCDTECFDTAKGSIDGLREDVRMDIFFRGTKSATELKQFAGKLGVKVSSVSNKDITLNFDKQHSKLLNVQSNPTVIIKDTLGTIDVIH